MKHDPHDPERALRPRAPEDWSGTLFDFPTAAPAARVEQREIPLGGTIAERYAVWRGSEEGQRAWAWIARRALEEVAQGATRLSAKALVEACREQLHVRINNVATPCIARELEEQYPITRGLFELRRRSAA